MSLPHSHRQDECVSAGCRFPGSGGAGPGLSPRSPGTVCPGEFVQAGFEPLLKRALGMEQACRKLGGMQQEGRHLLRTGHPK